MEEIINSEALEELLELDGIEKMSIHTKVVLDVKKRNTEERDKNFQQIRERKVSEDEISDIVENSGLSRVSYSPNIDSVGDFIIRDRLRMRTTIEESDL